jgi:hypothetical protein
MSSDHSPVFATFQIGGFKQYVSDAATPGIGLSTNNKAQIVIDRCQAKVTEQLCSSSEKNPKEVACDRLS